VQAGDWVRRWDGELIQDLPAFMHQVASSQPGREIPISIWRGGHPVLERFRVGRRPPAQGRLFRYPPLWVDARGRVLVPGRTGVCRVDPRAGLRTPFWRWEEPGVVRRLDVLAGQAFVTVQRGLLPDTVVALDLQTGRERWRHTIRGQIASLRAVGSALWVQTQAPSQALLLDRRDGRPRALLRTFDVHREEFRKNWEPVHIAAVAAGRLYLVQGTDAVHQFLAVNTTRGRVEVRAAWAHEPRSFGPFVNPQVAANAFVSVVRGAGLRLTFPDPLGGHATRSVDLGPTDLLSSEPQRGPLDDEARVYLRGRTVYVVRLPQGGRRLVNTSIFGVAYEALDEQEATGGPRSRLFHFRTEKVWMGGSASPSRYVLSARPTFEGILVCAAQFTGEHVAEAYWIASLERGGLPGRGSLRLLLRDMREARRQAPVRIGRSLFVPTDEGADVFPLRMAGED